MQLKLWKNLVFNSEHMMPNSKFIPTFPFPDPLVLPEVSIYSLLFAPTFCILICNLKNQEGGRDGFTNSQASHEHLSTESQKSSCSSIEISMETKSGHDNTKTYSTLTKQSPRKNTVQLLGQPHARC
jgi:hypothetical protein